MAARDVQVTVNGQRSFTYGLIQKDIVWRRIQLVATKFSSFDLDDGDADIAIRYSGPPVQHASVRRLAANVPVRVEGGTVHFRIDRPGAYQVDAGAPGGHEPVVIFANAPRDWTARPGDIRFAPGKISDIGVLSLRRPGQRVYIPGGAVVRGIIRVEAPNVALAGNGLLLYDDAVAADPRVKALDDDSPILATEANGLQIDGLTVVVAPRKFARTDGDGPVAPWAVHLLRSSGVTIGDLKIINSLRDGLDIDGSDHVAMHGGYVQSMDDSLCIKSTNYGPGGGAHDRNVTDVTFDGIMAMNAGAGRVLMIGTELHAAEISRIAYRDIDILHALPPRGVAVSIANGDRADVHDILYEDIRVLDRPDRLLNFTVEVDGYRPDTLRGRIRNITLRRLTVPAQTATSVIHGMPGRSVGEVRFEDLRIAGKPAPNQLPGLIVGYASAPLYQ